MSFQLFYFCCMYVYIFLISFFQLLFILGYVHCHLNENSYFYTVWNKMIYI
jgi:hypothetical protein